jgi:L,D-peptidoglycan transpeptidase YkuD (ErfK/YbiS/YcfS/YnhG family)
VVQPEDIHGGKTLGPASSSSEQSAGIASSPPPAGQPRGGDEATGQPVAAEAGAGTGFSGGPLHTSRQLILIVAPDWNTPHGEVFLYNRENPHSPWKRLENSTPCMLGRNGLAWGRGLVDQDIPGPRKKEGDGRTPAGLFPLPFVFGYDSSVTAKQSGVRMPYFELTSSMVCVTDGHSAVFNEIADTKNPKGASWTCQERMVRDNNANRLGVFIGHNRRDPKPEAGSCVFLDIQPTQPTGGSIGCPKPRCAESWSGLIRHRIRPSPSSRIPFLHPFNPRGAFRKEDVGVPPPRPGRVLSTLHPCFAAVFWPRDARGQKTAAKSGAWPETLTDGMIASVLVAFPWLFSGAMRRKRATESRDPGE